LKWSGSFDWGCTDGDYQRTGRFMPCLQQESPL
jgi:hypothetical protein